MKHIEMLLEELRGEVQGLRADVRTLKQPTEPPLIFDLKLAAHHMSKSVSQVKALIRAGQLATCWVGKRRGVPRSEIERLARSAAVEAKPKGPGRPPTPPRGRLLRSHGNAIRALTKRKD